MLQLILGRAGTGKSSLLQDRLCKRVLQGGKVLLLVPEQFSFESERAIYRLLGSYNMQNVEVVSFTKLSGMVFRACGGVAGRRMDDTARMLLMRTALDEVSQQFSYYKNIATHPSFLELMVQTVGSFKMAGISPTGLMELGGRVHDETLQKKLAEISLCYEAFEALVGVKFVDPLDDVSRAAKLAAESGFFTNYELYIDGFMSFTGAQLELLRVMVEDCVSVDAAFCADMSQQGEHSIFATALGSAQTLEQMAKTAFVEVLPPIHLTHPHRFAGEGVATAEVILSGGAVGEHRSCEGVEIWQVQQPYDEVEYTAAEICRLVRKEDMRYRDIAVICRDIERYRWAVESVFARYDIPVFADDGVDVESHPFVLFLLSGLEAVRGQYKTRDLLRLAKSPLMGLAPIQAAALENYCYVWSVEGAQWEQEFKGNPDAVSRGTDVHTTLEELNKHRKSIIKILEKLKMLSRGCTGLEFAKACHGFFVQTKSHKNFLAYCDALSPAEKKTALELGQGVYDKLMDILDMFATLMKGVRKPLGQYVELLHRCITLAEVGQIPQTLDQVGFGDARHMRPHRPKAVFLLGANTGVFPSGTEPKGAFSRREHALLAGLGVELSPPPAKSIVEERFYFYRAATAPSHRLYVLCAKYGLKGEELQPSMLYTNLAVGMSDSVCSHKTELCHRVTNLATAREELTRIYAPDNPEVGSLAEFLEQNGQGEVLAGIRRAYTPTVAGNLSAENAVMMFGRDLQVSATRVEEFHRCAFAYFCKFGLGVQTLRKAGFSPLESGSVIHRVLEEMVRRHGGKALSDIDSTVLHSEIVAIIEQYLQEMTGDSGALSSRTLYQFHRMVSILVRVLKRIGGEFAQSLFRPVGVEVRVGEGREVEPLGVTAAGGVKVSVRGTIDRVDVMAAQGEKYARVIDYKSGGKTFDLTDVYHGLNMQMLIYLFALCEGGQGELAGCSPAGILYMPAATQILDMPRESEPQEVAHRHDEKLCMNGLVLREEDVLKGMEEALEGKYIPIKRLKSGELSSTASLTDQTQLASIKKHVLKLMAEMGVKLSGGVITPKPRGRKNNSPCDFCDYGELCHLEWLAPPPPYTTMKPEDFYALLDSEEGGESNER